GCLMTSAGWGHQAIVGGHFARLGVSFPHAEAVLREAAIRCWVPLELEGELADREGLVVTGVEGMARAISRSPADAVAQGSSLEALQGAAIAALELVRRAPDLRAIHGVTYAREVLEWATVAPVHPAHAQRLLSFVGGGWERGRRDRRVRGASSQIHGGDLLVDTHADWAETVGELCRIELRPGFAHNVKIAECCAALADLLPGRFAPLALDAMAATVPAWSRSRRPWMVLKGALRPAGV
ncbi:MAG: hypothetical protein KDA24_30290, partial [Deltaproteobacteria bacterium]|nr:hypothetical protein [Deltaproteobacteria bacterium]